MLWDDPKLNVVGRTKCCGRNQHAQTCSVTVRACKSRSGDNRHGGVCQTSSPRQWQALHQTTSSAADVFSVYHAWQQDSTQVMTKKCRTPIVTTHAEHEHRTRKRKTETTTNRNTEHRTGTTTNRNKETKNNSKPNTET